MIDRFDGQYRFLSNFYTEKFIYHGYTWKSVEHAFQAFKFYPDKERMSLVCEAATPGEAKKLGRQFGMRNDWEAVKIPIMTDLVRNKFYTRYLADRLVETGDEELVEGNSWKDFFWGVCNGVGENHLGKILMMIRKEISDFRNREDSLFVKDIVSYKTSTDYYQLWELARKQSVICLVGVGDESFDIARTVFSECDNGIEISCRGLGYIDAHTLVVFVEQCVNNNVRFVVPELEKVN